MWITCTSVCARVGTRTCMWEPVCRNQRTACMSQLSPPINKDLNHWTTSLAHFCFNYRLSNTPRHTSHRMQRAWNLNWIKLGAQCSPLRYQFINEGHERKSPYFAHTTAWPDGSGSHKPQTHHTAEPPLPWCSGGSSWLRRAGRWVASLWWLLTWTPLSEPVQTSSGLECPGLCSGVIWWHWEWSFL